MNAWRAIFWKYIHNASAPTGVVAAYRIDDDESTVFTVAIDIGESHQQIVQSICDDHNARNQ